MYADDIPKIGDYFHQELDYLRSRAAEFARDYPRMAHELELSQGKSADPHVEQLIQSFAFLTGRIRRILDSEYSQIPNGMLEVLYPHLAAPAPSMCVAQVQVMPGGANFANGYTLPRGRRAYGVFETGAGPGPTCRFTTCYDTDLWPLEIIKADVQPQGRPERGQVEIDVPSMLQVTIANQADEELRQYPLRSLRFYINGDHRAVRDLYCLLRGRVRQVQIRDGKTPGGPPLQIIDPENLEFIGFDEDQAVLPSGPALHPGCRLLQEYFLFPEKFLFFQVNGIKTDGLSKTMVVSFLLDEHVGREVKFEKDSLLLNCAPLINLFESHIEPIALDHRRFEYQAFADRDQHRWLEIHSLTEVMAISRQGQPRRLSPFYSPASFFEPDNQDEDYFWTARRENSQRKRVPGTEMYISFHDRTFDPKLPAAEVIAGRALCTNRRLPESLQAGQVLMLEGPGPVNGFGLVTQPTRHMSPELEGFGPWSLASLLTLNHLSLGNDEKCLPAFKAILHQYADNAKPAHGKQIDSIEEMRCRKIVRHIGRDAWRGFCRGVEIVLTFNESEFEGISIILFSEVLHHFFALYTTLNSFTQLAVKSTQRKGIVKKWHPLAGEQAVL